MALYLPNQKSINIYQMKKYILILTFFTFVNLFAQDAKINWVTVSEALELQKKNPKPIFMDVYTTWCGPCKMLDAQVFNQPQFIDLINKNYYAVKFNGEGNEAVNYKGVKYANPGYDPSRTGRNAMHEFTGFLQVKGYPSMYILDEKGEQKNVIVGFRTVDQLISELGAK